MWWWKVLLVLPVIFKYTLSQPIIEDSSNDRLLRQLDVEECCPCYEQSNTHHDVLWDPVSAGSENVRTRSRDVGDCPCRIVGDDAQGASSVFFPTAMRAAGSFFRTGETKENLKPLFNPEVDLASSVLKTLREATDEEYQDALARDAAKSATKAVEDFVFGDATPQESANLVTIVVNPNAAEQDDDEIMSQPSHNQQSRCIHPLQSSKTDFGKMRMAPKSNLYFHKPVLPKAGPRLLHRNLYDMDSGVGASNVHEHIVSVDRDTETSKTSPTHLATNKDAKSALLNDMKIMKVPDLRSVSVQDKLKHLDLSSSPLFQSLRDKTVSSLSRVPKLRLGGRFPEKVGSNVEDLKAASSVINEQAAKKALYFRNRLPLEITTQKRHPLSLPNLLNLKDVELVPLKDLISKQVDNGKLNKSKLALPSIFSRSDVESSSQTQTEHFDSQEHKEVIPRNNIIDTNTNDSEGSPTLVNIQVNSIDKDITDDYCDEGESEWKFNANTKEVDTKTISTEILDTLPDTKEEQRNVLEKDCIEDGNHNQDSIIDASNSHDIDVEQQQETNLHILHQSLQKEKATSDESCDQGVQSNDSSEDVVKPKIPLIDSFSLNKTLSTLKEKIAKNLKDLKNTKTIATSKKIQSHETANADVQKINVSVASIENQDEGWRHEASINLNSEETTTVNPDISEESLEDATTMTSDLVGSNKDTSECFTNAVSMQDLQNLSNSMLQQEEQEKEANSIDDSASSDQVIEESLEGNNREINRVDSDKSADTSIANTRKDEDTDSFHRKDNDETACKSEMALRESSPLIENDVNAEASNIFMKTIPEAGNILGVEPIMQPALNLFNKPLSDLGDILKLPPIDPLSTIDDIKDKIKNLFDNDDRNVEDFSTSETKPLDALHPTMATDASTSNFKSRAPPPRFLEDANFDIFDLRPQSSILPNIPKIDLYSYQPKLHLPLPKDISLKPIKLQSILENKADLLGGPLNHKQKGSNVLSSPIDIRPRLDNMRERLIDGPIEATNNIHTNLKNTQKAWDTRLRQLANNNLMLKNPNKSAPSFVESISRTHEDFNSKLRALHMDFNDRIETLHNDLVDRSKLLTSGPRNTKSKFRSSSILNKQNKVQNPMKQPWQASSRRESQRALIPHKHVQKKPIKVSSPPKLTEHKKLKMPEAASVPVPRTIQIPELKTALTKSSSLTLQRNPGVAGRQESSLQSKTLFNKPLNSKTSQIKVSFSTTPRPRTANFLKFRDLSDRNKKQRNLGLRSSNEDANESPSERRYSRISVPNTYYKDRQRHTDIDMNKLSLRKSTVSQEDKVEDIGRQSSKSAIHSWPKANDGSFLSKVKEAVQSRLSKVNSPKILKQISLQSDEKQDDDLLSLSRSDMARSATENKEIVGESPLKENVPYKCRMVCTKED